MRIIQGKKLLRKILKKYYFEFLNIIRARNSRQNLMTKVGKKMLVIHSFIYVNLSKF